MYINSVSLSFGRTNKKPGSQYPIMHGANYSQIEISKDAEKQGIEILKTNPRNITGQNLLMESYIPSAIKKSESFLKKHPEFDVNDVVQTAMLATALTSRTYKPEAGKTFSEEAEKQIDKAFKAMAESTETDVEIIPLHTLKNFADKNSILDKLF